MYNSLAYRDIDPFDARSCTVLARRHIYMTNQRSTGRAQTGTTGEIAGGGAAMLHCVGQESCGGILVRWPDLKLFDASQQARSVPVLMVLGLRAAVASPAAQTLNNVSNMKLATARGPPQDDALKHFRHYLFSSIRRNTVFTADSRICFKTIQRNKLSEMFHY
jgi:hypothetical protein